MDALTPTELGSLPSDWRVQRFDSLFAVQQGKQVSKANRIGENQRPFLRTKNVSWGGLDLSDLDEMHFTEAEEKRLALHPGDLLVCEGGDIGRTAIWNDTLPRCYYQNHLHRARLRDKGAADSQFALYWLWYAFEIGSVYFGRGNVTTIPNLSQSKLCELPLPVPPLLEQRKIAGVLGVVQRAMEQQERLLALTAELKKALLHQLFTAGLRGEPQKQTDLGPMPESWELSTLGDIAHVKGGKRLPKGDKFADEPTPFPYIRVTDLAAFGVDTSDLRFLRPDTQASIRHYTISKDDVYISIAGSIGITGMIPPELEGANLTENAAKLVLKMKSVAARFLMYFLGCPSAQNAIKAQTVKNAQPKLALARIASLTFPIPSLDEQVDIATALDAVSAKEKVHQRKHIALTALFRTLLHQLMTAQIRVHDLDLPGLEQLTRE